LYKAINDYAVDRRGDVGSWVREEAMRTITALIQNLASSQLYNEMQDVLGPEA